MKEDMMTISRGRVERPRVSLGVAMTFAFVLTGAVSAFVAAAQAPGVTDPKIGTGVTIRACLRAGDNHDSFVLVNVTERPAGDAPSGIYWLNSTKGLRPFVGQWVDIVGQVTAREAKLGTVTLAIDPTEALSDTVKVESEDADVKSEEYNGRPEPDRAATSPSINVTVRPVYRLDVKHVSAAANIDPLGPTCR
jgi:hypothetical protein